MMLNLKQEGVSRMANRKGHFKKHKINKRIKITDQCNQYIEQDSEASKYFSNKFLPYQIYTHF